jgi:hypothetical protein
LSCQAYVAVDSNIWTSLSACFLAVCLYSAAHASPHTRSYTNHTLASAAALRRLRRPSTLRTSTSSAAPSATCTWRTSTSWAALTSGTGAHLQWCHRRSDLS